MSYRGRPSKGCEACRARKVKCDESKPVCHRCSKSGHECRYRDQSDLLFRNQTAFAAQKAEDSWRKRSKSHQRAGSEGSSQQSSPSNTQSPSNANSSPGNVKSQELVQEETPPEFNAPVVNFNELSIAPGMKPDLRRLAYERFVYDFVIFETPHKPPEEPSDALWEFIPYLYQRSAEGSCFATITDACAYANFANRCNAPQASALASECMGRAIQLVSQTISNKETAHTDEALCSVYLMGVYENLIPPGSSGSNGNFNAHSGGANALLQLRSVDEFYNNTVSASIYEVSFSQMLINALQAAKPPVIPIKNIIAARQYLPNFYSTSGIYVIQLIHNEALLHARWHETKRNLTQPASRLELQELLQIALDLDAEFQAWESTIPRTWRYKMERNTPEARATQDPKWRDLILGSGGAPEEMHCYTTLKKCWIWMFYRTSRIFLLRDLLEILNWMFRLPELSPSASAQHARGASDDPSSISNKPSSPALDNVGLQIHYSFATTHLVNIVEKSCSAILGFFTVSIYGKSSHDVVGMRGYSPIWTLGTMDAVLKSGLVPDSGASSNPRGSNDEPPVQQQTASFSQFLNAPPPSPAVFRMPPQNRSPLYNQGPVYAPQSNEFPRLPPIPDPGTQSPTMQPTQTSAAIAVPGPSTSKKHLFDSSPSHPFDLPTNLPTVDFTITKPARIDVAARRGWINRILTYIAQDVGIPRASAIPATEGYLELCEAQLKEIFQ